MGRQRLVGKLEPHLVVPLPRATVGHGVGALFKRHLHLRFGEHRPRQRGPQQVLAFVNRARLDSFPKGSGYKLLTEILDKNLARAAGQSLPADGGVIVALANVPDHRDDFAAVIFPQPGNDDGGIKPSRIGQNGTFDLGWR